jgi:hypothetical protein
MKTKVIWGLALAAIGALVTWIALNTYWEEVEVPMPLKDEAARNPFYAAQRFVEGLGATSVRDRIQVDVPEDGVVVLSSWHWSLVEGRRSRLEEWVEAGGRLVIDRSLIGGEDAFTRWSGISRRNPRLEDAERRRQRAEAERDEGADDTESSTDDESQEESEPSEEPSFLRPNAPCRKLTESTPPAAGQPSAADGLRLCVPSDGSYLMTTRDIAWSLRDDVGNQVLRVNIGKGSVTVINALPFRYRLFLEGDHARLLALAAQLRHGDEVHFLSEEEQASILTLMWVYGWPVVVLFLAWIGLALWRNSVRFGPLVAATDTARRSIAEQIRGTGQFVMRFGGGKALHAAAVRSLDEAAQARLSAYRRMPADERIEAVARLAGLDASALGPAVNHSGPRRPHELRQALALIETARRRILIGKGR